MTFSLPPRTLVLGGSSSGKSAFAERLVMGTGRARHYVATAQAFDDEMRAKIAEHQVQRGPDWVTHEAPFDLSILSSVKASEVMLLDCATLWLSNALLAERNMADAQATFMDAVRTCPAPIVVVSNEVGHGIVPDHKLGRVFRGAQGRLNQAMAADADLVVFVTAGLPQVLKGNLP